MKNVQVLIHEDNTISIINKVVICAHNTWWLSSQVVRALNCWMVVRFLATALPVASTEMGDRLQEGIPPRPTQPPTLCGTGN